MQYISPLLNILLGLAFLVTDGINKYSVPYDLIGEPVDVRVSKNTVEVFYHNTRVAAHVRIPLIPERSNCKAGTYAGSTSEIPSLQ